MDAEHVDDPDAAVALRVAVDQAHRVMDAARIRAILHALPTGRQRRVRLVGTGEEVDDLFVHVLGGVPSSTGTTTVLCATCCPTRPT